MTVRRVPGRPATLLRRLAPEVLREPVQSELFEGLWPGLAGLPVEADLGIPGVEHLLPLRPDGLPLRGAVHRRRAVAGRRILHGAGVAAAERGRPVDDGRPLAEAERLLDRESPARRRRQRTADVLEPSPRREDADQV